MIRRIVEPLSLLNCPCEIRVIYKPTDLEDKLSGTVAEYSITVLPIHDK